MFALWIGVGVIIGVVYEKQIRAWKHRTKNAANAAMNSFREK